MSTTSNIGGGWEEEIDMASNKPYYHNTLTGDVSFERPSTGYESDVDDVTLLHLLVFARYLRRIVSNKAPTSGTPGVGMGNGAGGDGLVS